MTGFPVTGALLCRPARICLNRRWLLSLAASRAAWTVYCMSALSASLSQAALASCARSAAVRDGILACSSLDDPELALGEMLLVAQDALIEAYMSVETISRALDQTPDATARAQRTFDEVVEAISCETTYLAALASFLVEQLAPLSRPADQRAAVDSLCVALLGMG